jgi:hypothetical protein
MRQRNASISEDKSEVSKRTLEKKQAEYVKMLRSYYNPVDRVKPVVEEKEEFDEFENCDLDDNEIQENPEGLNFATNQMQT